VTERTAPRRWTLRRRIAQGFLAAGTVLALVTAAIVVSTIEFARAGGRVVDRWQPAVSASGRLLVDLVEQQSSLRGFALSRDPSLAERYRQYAAAETRDAAALQRLIGTDARLRTRFTALESAAGRWQTTVARPALAAVGAGSPDAVQVLDGAIAARRFDSVRSRAAALTAGIEDRTHEARTARRTAGIVFVLAISLAAVMFVVLAAAIWRGLHRWVLGPVDRLGLQTREVARGDTYRQIVPGGPVEFARLGTDVEAMRLQIAGQLARAEEIQEELRQRTEELLRSNDDLQQFAYVASHDLSEPLRKVANFCQLLERQYRDELDDRAKEYIDFAVDGAKRMQALISDLLALSRVGRTTDEFVAVDLDAVLDTALAALTDRIDEAGAQIDRVTPLPTVAGDPSLLASLFENLIGNAVKYRRADVPAVVRISAEQGEADRSWTFTVTDNGIGIDPEYAERIFAVFQRLHVRDSYGGTGIGLALCRKIVEFHQGRIWLDPVQSSHGATFRFVLPEGELGAESRD
jgi:signal transduction histidine kinase